MNMFVEIFAALNKARIKYLVVGGVAANFYGFKKLGSLVKSPKEYIDAKRQSTEK